MKYKDTLTLYEELVATGISDEQAKIQAHQLGGVTDFLEQFHKDITGSLNGIKQEIAGIKKDLYWMYGIGAAMTLTFLGNAIFK